jgi:hypothetical protein
LVAEFGAQRSQGIDGITRTRTLHFARIQLKARVAGNRPAHHFQPVGRCSTRRAAMRRLSGGNEQHALEADRLGHFLGQPQVTEMDRIEGSAENTYRR